MIGYLSGKILNKDNSGILIDVNGVGYQVHVSSHFADNLTVGEKAEVYVQTNLRENALDLFGFENLWEKQVFLLLTSVSGIGPKIAISALGALNAEQILTAIARGDKKTLNSLPGIGKKTAERLIVELADKAKKLSLARGVELTDSKSHIPPQGASATENVEALEALLALGYREQDAMTALREVSAKCETKPKLQDLIKESLQWMAKN